MWHQDQSVYREKFQDEIGVFFDETFFPKLRAKPGDYSDSIQEAIDYLVKEWGYGILYIPEGEYPITKTIFIPPSVRLIGFGEKRPKFILPENTKGFDGTTETISDPSAMFRGGYPGAKYMFWFIGDKDTKAEEKRDADAATFYSAISNIDFEIKDGNPGGVCIRAHFAQHGFISHCSFYLGNGLAGIFDVGNEMEDLSFYGGQYGILCRNCSPGWPYVLLDSHFEGQMRASVRTSRNGFTGFRLVIKNTPKAFDILYPGQWEKLYLEDCIFENISDTGITFDRDDNAMTQVNITRLYCKNVPKLIHKLVSGQEVLCSEEVYLVKEYTHGYCLEEGSVAGETEIRIFEGLKEFPPSIDSNIPSLPPMNQWISVKDYGAVGDGYTDDTAAIRKAIESEPILYFPQGMYRITDTIEVSKDITMIGMSPITTQILLLDDEEAFSGFGTPKALVETKPGTNVIFNGIGIDTAGKNPRASGIIWQSSKDSYCNDVKFLGGHGGMFRDGRNAYAYLYNPSRTADYNPDRIWDFQYASLWVTNQGGGTFKDIWSASPYAEAGIVITETSTPGNMYCVSLEHHVRHEMKIYQVANWNFYGFQTEEEKAEGMECQPIEITRCENLLFANLFMFRVVAVDKPYESVIRVWNSKNIVIKNAHNYAQMQFAFNLIMKNPVTGFMAKAPEYAKITYTGNTGFTKPTERDGIWKVICEGMTYASGAAIDKHGNIAFCDKPNKKIYMYYAKEARLEPIMDIHFIPSCLAFDEMGNLLVAVDYTALKKTVPGQGFLHYDRNEFHPFFSWFYKRSEKVYTFDIEHPYTSMTEILQTPNDMTQNMQVFRPGHSSYFGVLPAIMEKPLTSLYVGLDGKTALEGSVDLARSIMLKPVIPGKSFYITEDDTHLTYSFKAGQNGNLAGGELVAPKGAFGSFEDRQGIVWIVEDYLYGYKDGKVLYQCDIPAEAYMIVGYEDTVYLFGREKIYQSTVSQISQIKK